MNRLYYGDILPNLPAPDFGPELETHISRKKHPEARAASLSAWNLLALALKAYGLETLPRVHFTASGKPCFSDSPLHFSISHSAGLAAVLLSDAPCAVDIECWNPQTAQRLSPRCLSEAEKASGIDFFEAWTKKECIGKLDGRGICARPALIDTTDPQYSELFFNFNLCDAAGRSYTLSALCTDAEKPQIERMMPDVLA